MEESLISQGGRMVRSSPLSGSTFYIALAGLFLIGLGVMGLWNFTGQSSGQRPGKSPPLERIPFNGKRAYGYLQEICDLGPRISGSQAMAAQQKRLQEHFKELGGRVSWQEFTARNPLTGKVEVPMANLIVEWHPERKERILLCCHYDTRPYPDNDPDPRKRKGLFLGANDGASGAALLMELATHMQDLPGKYGVDFVLFDGEELVYDNNRDPYFLGSEHFAQDYVANPPAHRYRWGVLVDMIGDAELQLYQEQHSVSWRDTAPLVDDIWSTARRLGVVEFVPRVRHEVRDDHLALRNIAKIPTCDIIDFDYPRPGRVNYWHTTADVPANCSAASLAKVGWVLHEWLKQVK